MIVILNLDMTKFGTASSIEEALQNIKDNVPEHNKAYGTNEVVHLQAAANHDYVMVNGIVTFMLVD